MKIETEIPPTINFTGTVEVTDQSVPTGFEQYLYLETDGGARCEAWGIDDNTPMDLEMLLTRIYGYSIDIEPEAGGRDYAAIITNGRAPNSSVVWQSCNFYVNED